MLKVIQLFSNHLNRWPSDLISWCVRLGLPKIAIDDHLSALAEKNAVHPVKNWLDCGQWDGLKRVDAVISCFNAKNAHLAQIVLRHWLTGCVASLYEKCFSSKLVPILVGEQSYMKTTAISRMSCVVDGAFLEGAELNPDSKDSVLSIIKSWVVELGELERTNKNSQGSLKAFITRQIDTVRPPYARIDVHKPRQTHLIASVNGDSFLKDESGSLRYAVIELEKAVNIDKLNELLGWQYNQSRIRLIDSDKLKQFWLEIKYGYEKGDGWNLSREHSDMLSAINDNYSDKGTWYDFLIERYVHVDDAECITRSLKASEVCDLEKIDKRHSRQLGQALKRLANEGKIKSTKGRANATFYALKCQI